MTHFEMRALLDKRPFEPFRIYLKDGRSFDIEYPRHNLVSELRMVVGKPDPQDPGLTEFVTWIYWRDISKVEKIPVPVSA